jgi:hypothetical protein
MYLSLTIAVGFIVKLRGLPRRTGTPDAAHFPCLGCVPQAASQQDLQAIAAFPGGPYSIDAILFMVRRPNSKVQWSVRNTTTQQIS